MFMIYTKDRSHGLFEDVFILYIDFNIYVHLILSCIRLFQLIVFFILAIDLSCNVPVDLVFVLDGSDSLKESEFSASKQFVLDVIQSLTLGKQNVQVTSQKPQKKECMCK